MSDSLIIKVGFCVAYDWELLKTSLPLVYPYADRICLSLDKDRKSWAGNHFEFNEHKFNGFLKEIDKDNKILLIEKDFSDTCRTTRENCNLQRTAMAEALGTGGWHIQIDADEYFLDFENFVNYLKKLHPCPTGKEKPFNVLANYVPLIKQVNGGFLYVDFLNSIPESAPFATTSPKYERARHNGYFNMISPFYVVHETWARNEDDLWFKINNWGHSSEELHEVKKRKSYFDLWKALDENNYFYVRNFHPAVPVAWPALDFQMGTTAAEFIDNFKVPKFPVSDFQISLRNSRNIARLKMLYYKMKS
ncbi:hypothetical protein [Cesiribacter andamanensis]|uniref:Glycosyl transferase family 2 n=1 Tax=Cesiribacter andamanensis AMV16 TaxID=1279009 RepID=M7NPQ6_9BACT|nr:hypothetical protein [Cesiribacter andamanensis]EMR03695.1 hypothetical protein ADICEAN_01129 [Cesiribacter andamanensis AMV16]